MDRIDRVRLEANRTYEAGFSITPAGRVDDEKAAGYGWKTWEPNINPDGSLDLNAININYGIRGGKLRDGRNLIIIDFDHVDDEERNQEFLKGHCAAITPNGRHMFCTITDEQVKAYGVKAGHSNILGIGPDPDYVPVPPKHKSAPPKEGQPGSLDTTDFPELAGLIIDYKYEGGYVIAPGSYVDDKPYFWYHKPTEYALQPVPEIFLKAIKANNDSKLVKPAPVKTKSVKGGDIVDDAIRALQQAKPGDRNNTVNAVSFKVGRRLVSLNLDYEDTKARLVQAAIDVGQSPTEAEATVNSGLTKGQENPINLKKPTELDIYSNIIDDLKDLKVTDIGFVRYYPEFGQWMDISDTEAITMIDSAILEVYGDTVLSKRIHDVARRFKHRSSNRIPKVRDPKTGTFILPWDQKPEKLTFTNLVYNVNSGSFEDFNRENYTRTVFNYAFDPNATCPNWEKAMADIAATQPEEVLFLQEYMGVCLTTEVKQEIAAYIFGPAGGGKSTVILGFETVLGALCDTFNLADLSKNFGLSRVEGRNLLVSSEQNSIYIEDTGTLNALISGDSITVEEKFKASRSIKPTAKLLFASNEPPKVKAGLDDGWYRRFAKGLIKLPALTNRDPAVKEGIKTEAQGILLWALEGLHRYKANGFTHLPRAEAILDSIREDSNPILQFIGEKCTAQEDTSVRASVLFNCYKEWAKESGHKPMSQTSFGKAMATTEFIKKRLNVGQTYIGISLNNTETI